jgi:hypothetical protein
MQATGYVMRVNGKGDWLAADAFGKYGIRDLSHKGRNHDAVEV